MRIFGTYRSLDDVTGVYIIFILGNEQEQESVIQTIVRGPGLPPGSSSKQRPEYYMYNKTHSDAYRLTIWLRHNFKGSFIYQGDDLSSEPPEFVRRTSLPPAHAEVDKLIEAAGYKGEVAAEMERIARLFETDAASASKALDALTKTMRPSKPV